MARSANLLRSEKALTEPVFALFRRDSEGREQFTGLVTRRDLAQHSGWPTVRAYPIRPDQLVLL